MKRIASVILWSVIAAAFIGPGTVTTAASAGAGFGLALLWAVLFSVLATFVLQETAARVSIASGSDLAALLRRRFPSGFAKWAVLVLVPGAILLGNAAYEAGNILGGAAGALLALETDRRIATLAIGGAAALLLWTGSPGRIAQVMAALVALMGAGFLAVAAMLLPDAQSLAAGFFVPSLPEGAGVAALALVGTTVVPYNLFLGSSLARGQDLASTRLGLAVAIGLGGLVTAAILVTGTAMTSEFSFEGLAVLLEELLGDWARIALALGLFCAGLTSAVTAPLAAAFTARGLFASPDDASWAARGWRFRAVWIAILSIGLLFGLGDVRPVPAIVLAQAFNGILLPLVAIVLLVAANDRRLLGRHANGWRANTAAGAVVLLAIALGASALNRAIATAIG